MSKLHELLAVEGNLKTQAEKTRTELMATFDKKPHLFSEKVVTFIPLEEGAPQVREEQLDLQTTVEKELAWVSTFMRNAMDVSYQVAEANTSARADVILENGDVLLTGLPTTALLELEKRVSEMLALVKTIPTLDPAKGFTPDTQRGDGIFKARDDNKNRTKKIEEPLVLYEATKEHPAQVKLVGKDVVTGKIQTQEWSGKLTTAAKGDMLERVEDVMRAVKKARSRANEQDIDVASKKIGAKVLAYVFAL